MAIKLRARLSAYSKVATTSVASIPDPSMGKNGAILGAYNGKYEFIEPATPESIDNLFDPKNDAPQISVVTKEMIDDLFDDKPNKNLISITEAQIDTLFENEEGTVSHAAIDSLFDRKRSY